ncbi:MAG: hypothetical protein H5T72_02045 [Actinobacteria bacterium]|nr:hypothetical protein [Actinomycetota bacterium]
MIGKHLEIDGRVYDLEDPEERKAAVRAWLRSRSGSRRGSSAGEKPPGEKSEPGRTSPSEDKAGHLQG